MDDKKSNTAFPKSYSYFNEVTSIRNELKEIRAAIDSLNAQIATYHNRVISLREFVGNEQVKQAHCLTDIQTQLAGLNSSVSGISNLDNIISEIERIKGIEEIVGNIDYNLRNATSSSSGDEEYKNMLRQKVAEYEEDLYKKLMRKYVIDSLISLYTYINDKLRISGTDDFLKKILENILYKLQTLGIEAHSSKPGDSFDPRCMTTGHYSNIVTNDDELDGKVAESVCPMFVWKYPELHQHVQPILLKEEEVTLYQSNKNNF